MFKKKRTYVEFLEGIMLGGSLAAVASFVFGTKKGKKIQMRILSEFKKLGHKAEHYFESAKKVARGPMSKKLSRLAGKAIKSKPIKKALKKVNRRKSAKRRAGR